MQWPSGKSGRRKEVVIVSLSLATSLEFQHGITKEIGIDRERESERECERECERKKEREREKENERERERRERTSFE
jgi:hypothetical protein